MSPITRQNVESTYNHYAGFYDLLFGAVLQGGRRRMCDAVRTEGIETGVGDHYLLQALRCRIILQITGSILVESFL